MSSSLHSQAYSSPFSLAAVGSLVSKLMMVVGIVVMMGEALLVACGCLFIYSWLFRGALTFHPGWSQEERAVLENLATDMRDSASPLRHFGISHVFRGRGIAPLSGECDWSSELEVFCAGMEWRTGEHAEDEGEENAVEFPWFLRTLFDDVWAVQHVSPLDLQLRQVALTGDARGAGALAVAAAAAGEEKAMKLLLLHGADPRYQCTDGHDVLSAWMGTFRPLVMLREELRMEDGRYLEVAEWLLQHGAVVRDEWELYSFVRWRPDAEAEKALEWLVDRGLSMKSYWDGISWELPLNDLVGDVELPLVRFCLGKGWADLNDTSGGTTALQKAVQWCGGEKEDAAVLHELLELGADPNLLPSPPPEPGEEGRESPRWKESPLRMVLSSLEEADASGRAVLLEMADDLLQHGARPEKCAIPDSPELERALEQLYHRYGYELEWETTLH